MNFTGYSWSQSLIEYLELPHTWIAVIVPMAISLGVLLRSADQLDRFATLQLLWWLSLPLMYATAHWRQDGETLSLYIVAWFSMACVFLAWRRMPVTPALGYALSFFSLFWVDLAHAFTRALKGDFPLDSFYYGVGGAGVFDGLVIFPLLTAAAIH